MIRDCVPHPFGAGCAVQIRQADLSNPEVLILPPCHRSGFTTAAGNAVIKNLWLGRQDSNLRMLIPKTSALPLGYAPTFLPFVA